MSEDNFGFPRYFQWSGASRKASGAQRVSGGEGRNGRIREMSVGNSGAAVPAAGAGVSPANIHAGGARGGRRDACPTTTDSGRPCGARAVGWDAVLEVAEQIAVGGKNQRGVVAEGFLVGFHGAEEAVKLTGFGAATVGAGVNLGGPGVGFTFDLLHFAVGLGFEAFQLLLPVAQDFRRLALAFGAESRSNLLALADHPVMDF